MRLPTFTDLALEAVVMRAEQPAVSPRNRRKGPLEGRDRFGKPQPMKGDPVVSSGICHYIKP